MGSSTYCVQDRQTRAVSQGFYQQSVEQTFSSRSMPESMNPKKITIREARDSENHPESFPIIICLDVTGSMDTVPAHLIKDGLPTLVTDLMERGITSPAILFMAVGDHKCDAAPLQVGQFESGDAELDHWLTTVWLEHGGGGNGGESYFLPWWFAANRCVTDHWDKRKKQGLLITIGDEPCHSNIHRDDLERIFGNGEYPSSITSQKLLEAAQEKWYCVHINLGFMGNGRSSQTKQSWTELMKEYPTVQSEAEIVQAIPPFATQLQDGVYAEVGYNKEEINKIGVDPNIIL